MKKIITLMIVVASLITTSGHSQFSISINIGTQPSWGPVGYDHVDYYYLPDIDAYYYVPDQVYYYRNGYNWTRTSFLPDRYRNFDLYHAHKVVINNVYRPYMQNDVYRRQYAVYRGKHDQSAIRDSHDERYFVNKDHPQHAEWEKTHGQNDRYQNDNRNRYQNQNDNRNQDQNRNRNQDQNVNRNQDQNRNRNQDQNVNRNQDQNRNRNHDQNVNRNQDQNANRNKDHNDNRYKDQNGNGNQDHKDNNNKDNKDSRH